MEEVRAVDEQETTLSGLPLEMWALIASYLPMKDFLSFSQAHTEFMAAARISVSHSPQPTIQALSDKLVGLLRGNTTRFSREQVESLWRLHQFYLLCGGQASLSLMKQQADELNKREQREKMLGHVVGHSQLATVGLCTWTTACWGVFGCCCSSNPCCCGLSITVSVLCCGSFALNQASQYEIEHNSFRSRFCDVEYDLEAHPGNDFQSVLPPRVEMDADQEVHQPILIEPDQQPSCFSRAFNFFRALDANNPNIDHVELAVRFEH